MKSNFLQPRFDGARFSEHTLPLEVARDLAAYETLVVELAKQLYIQEHPDRQRVPKGFASDFHLHLERVDEGSSRPLLSIVTVGALTLGLNVGFYFERARELITECVAAPEGHLPPEFPRSLLAHFNQIGRSLRPDERMELTGTNGKTACLTPDRRKHLVLAAEKVYEREIELSGTIGEADWEKSTFRLRLSDSNYAVVPMPEHFHSQARKFGGKNRDQVTITGIGTYDSYDNLQKIVSVETLAVQHNYQLSSWFDSILDLEDGWLDGKGKAPNKTILPKVAKQMVERYPEHLPLPVIAPTPEGNILLEWMAYGDLSIDISLDSLKAFLHAFQKDGKEIESEIALSSETDWNRLFDFLENTLERHQG
jgi:hypothetical protein